MQRNQGIRITRRRTYPSHLCDLDDSRFRPAEGSGVLVLTAPHQEQFERLLKEVDRLLFRPASGSSPDTSRMPLLGRKLHVHTDWQGEMETA